MTQPSELPEGPVTIMLTDIEGSTALRTSLGDAETDALLRQHDDLIREQIEAHKGYDQKAALGDGFLAAFVSTRRAVACAIAIQRSLDTFNRARSGLPLRLRVGLNTGEVAWKDGQLSGEAVHAAARVCASGDGGQIIVSDVTRQLAGTVPDVTFRDTGEHRLKGFPEPWRLWEVVWVRQASARAEPAFVGREQELAALRTRLSAALDGRGGLVLVGGEPGVGKTTLVKQLIREAEQRGALALFGRCYESEGAVPYSPFVEMLEQALTVMPPDIVRQDMGEDAAEIARMVPELRRRFHDIGDPLDLPPEQLRRYFFNAVASFVSRGADRFPLLLVMDDVHWADEPTLLLIEHMAALMPDLRVLGIGTYRDVELEVARPLAASLERMLRARTLERIQLHRFDRDGVVHLVEALAGKTPPDPVVDAIYSETEGNPFFVEEVFRHFVEEGKVFDESGGFRSDLVVDELDVPESIRLVVGRRLERLGDRSQKILAIGAVVGRAFSFSLLEELSDQDAGTLLDIIDDAEAARVIEAEERDGEVYFSFTHELIRQTLLSSLSILRRQRLHLAVADAIERLPEARDDRPSEIANHLLQAGSAADAGRLLDYLEASAQRAVNAAAFEEAMRTVDDALAVVGEEDRPRRARLLHLRGTALRATGDFDGCIEIWDRVMDLYRELGDGRAVAGLAYELGYLKTWLARFDEAYSTYEQALEVVGDERVPEAALCHGGLIVFSGFVGLYEEAATHHRDAIALATELDDRRGLGVAEFCWCFVELAFMRLPQAIEAGRRAVAHLRASNEQWTLVDGLVWLSFCLLFAGSRQEASELSLEAADLGRKLGHQGGLALAQRVVALARAAAEPDLDAYERAAREDMEAMRAIDSPWASQSHAWLATVLALKGDLDGCLREAEEATRIEPLSVWKGWAWCSRILGLALAGEEEACRAMLEEADFEPAGSQEPAPGGELTKLMSAAQAAAMILSEEHARRLYPVAAAYGHRTLTVASFEQVIAERVLGMAAGAAGLFDQAEKHFAEAERIAMEDSNAFDEPHVWLWHGKMLLDRGRPGDRDAALARIARARDEFARRGMPLFVRKADELLSTSSRARSPEGA